MSDALFRSDMQSNLTFTVPFGGGGNCTVNLNWFRHEVGIWKDEYNVHPVNGGTVNGATE